MTDCKYYVIYPKGRERLLATNRRDAMVLFHNHWSARASYVGNAKGTPLVRRLIEERSEELLTDTDLNVTPYIEYNAEEED